MIFAIISIVFSAFAVCFNLYVFHRLYKSSERDYERRRRYYERKQGNNERHS